MNDVIRERLKTVPNRPGCYLMRDRRGVIIYVGKAKNLRRRVLSYFRPGADLAPKVRSMVNSVADLEFMTVRNDAEALLTEASLIKKYKPHFNILMRDDGALYFGPFPSSPVVRAAKDFVEKRWGLRGCTALAPDEEAHTHCHADVIRFCSAPCLGSISAADYRVRFDEACAFLKGERPEVIAEVVEEMKEAAAKEDFRKAARLRDTVAALKEMTKAHFVRKSPEMRREDAGRGLAELAAALGLPKPPRVIECVDISNLFGTHNVASLVVAVDGLPDRRWYRHFKIESFEGADDPRAMAEVVRRRYGPDSTLTAKSPRADLYICDGGVTQLRAARAVFAELGITDIPTVGLAKRMEELVTDDGGEPLLLPRDSEGLMVVTRLRDEAHRFAITYHRSLRERTIRESALDDVPGIGPAKKMALLKRFHSVYGIARATEDEIAAVAGIGATLAAAVRKAAASAAGEKA